MNENLAGRLLAEIMKWTPEDVARERPELQSLAVFKYDDYQRFSPGMRFIESLALWLRQFAKEERKVAYEFIRNSLVYISVEEMSHLVSISYPDYIRHLLIRRVGAEKGIPDWFVCKIVETVEFKTLLRQSLFLGLSDGAHIDVFRRSNPEISHEQVLRTHEISRDRASSMLEELKKDLSKILGRVPSSEETQFRLVFLLDDFSGSGLSYIRKEGSSYAGKVYNFYREACKKNGEKIHHLFEHPELQVCLVLYVASATARSYLEKMGGQIFADIPFSIQVIHSLRNSVRLDPDRDEKFIEILEKHYDPTIETRSYLRGKHEKPYLGFNECGLPLVLSHNTPNNSACLLWFEENRRFRGLFPRMSRHR